MSFLANKQSQSHHYDSPVNTTLAPSHWRPLRLLPKNSTLPSTVKNLRVVVVMEHGSGPNSDTIRKMKNWEGTVTL